MSEPVLKKFGRYFLLDQIGEGGMAEIFRARMAAPGESGRFIVIKRIQGANSDNPEFAQMFRAEVQVTMRFTHPNIVQLYEAGEESGLQYIAMEWVEGKNLRQLLSRASQKQQRIPLAVSCHMVEQAAAGLHYAHSFKDRITGEPLRLVHRDVSPQNILVSYDGNIKIIDFGIAKAASNDTTTRAGVIKGKLSYLSPEQVLGDHLDGRSDLFALGIVLWELLTLKRLFVAEGDNEFQVLKMIESCTTYVKPPSTYNPDVPPEIDELVMQALKRDPDKRFQTGDEFSRALKRVLSQHYPDFGSSDLSTFVKKQFQDQIVEDRKALQQLNQKAEELIALGAKPPAAEKGSPGAPVQTREQTRMSAFQTKFDLHQVSEADSIPVSSPPDRQMKVPMGRTHTGASNVSTPAASGRASRTGSYQNPKVPPPPVQNAGIPWRAAGLLLLAGAGAFVYFNPGLWKKTRTPATVLNLDPADEAPRSEGVETGKIRKIQFRIFPDGGLKTTRVKINSLEVGSSNRVGTFVLGEPLDVSVEQPGFLSYRKEFVIREPDLQPDGTYLLEVSLEPKIFGEFTLTTIPELSEVEFINLDQGQTGSSEKPFVFTTPIYQQKLPVGNYRVIIRNKLLNVGKILQVEIREGSRVVRNGVALETMSGKR